MKKLKITFINVGNGDAVFIESVGEGSSFHMLVDGGSGEEKEYAESTTGRISAFDFLTCYGIDHLDLVVNTHIHEDHTCGLLPIVQKWPPNQFWQPYPLHLWEQMHSLEKYEDMSESLQKYTLALDSYKKICFEVRERGGSICFMAGNKASISLTPELKLQIAGPDRFDIASIMSHFELLYRERLPYYSHPGFRPLKLEEQFAGMQRNQLEWLDAHMNNSSLILAMDYKGKKLLLPGDTDCNGYKGLEDMKKVDLYKVGHHGQKNSLNAIQLEKIKPESAVISASSDRRYGSAHPEILEMLQKACKNGIYFTDCPQIPPYTDRLAPHSGLQFTIDQNGTIRSDYLKL